MEGLDQSLIGGGLSREQLRALILGPQTLLRDYPSLDDQLQPNGFDLTLHSVFRHEGRGTVGVDNSQRVLPDLVDCPFDDDGFVTLQPGPYHIVYNEIVRLPAWLMGLGRPRSSLARSGVAIHTGVWDAGYEGRSTSLMQVINPHGFRVARDARVLQLVFITLSASSERGYDGIYQRENTR
jgi:dUTP pyrophosphatase